MLDSIQYSIFALLLAFGLACIIQSDASPGDSSRPIAPWTQVSADDPTATFRHTNEGWQDTTYWRLQNQTSTTSFIESIHPLAWSVLLILVVYGLAILVSDEKQLRRLWSS